MQIKTETVGQVAFVMWSFLSILFFAFGAWLFLDLLFNAEYFPGPEYSFGSGPKLWEVLWDVSGALFIIPASWILVGLLFRRFASRSKCNRLQENNAHYSIEQ